MAKNGSNYLPEDVANNLSPEGRAQAIFGSKMTFVLEIFTLTATWTVKACLLLMYGRLTEGTSTRQRLGVTIVACYCIVTYLTVTFMFVFYWCNPTYEYWRVPVRISTLTLKKSIRWVWLLTDLSAMRNVLQPHDLRHGVQHFFRPDAAVPSCPHHDQDPSADEEVRPTGTWPVNHD